MKEVSGRPDPKHVSTSFVERQNWTVRGTMRRYTRLSNGFSRKMENHAAATALNYFSYNFIKIHRTLRTSPAMAAGVTDRLWSVEDLVVLWKAYESRRCLRCWHGGSWHREGIHQSALLSPCSSGYWRERRV
jgi:hypothetical protein